MQSPEKATSSIRSVQIWTCACGANYRTVSNLYRKPSPFIESTVQCVTCGRKVNLDGEVIEMHHQLTKDTWISVPV
jgi:hypothetical protein